MAAANRPPVPVHCNECGHDWESTAADRTPVGCKICGHKVRVKRAEAEAGLPAAAGAAPSPPPRKLSSSAVTRPPARRPKAAAPARRAGTGLERHAAPPAKVIRGEVISSELAPAGPARLPAVPQPAGIEAGHAPGSTGYHCDGWRIGHLCRTGSMTRLPAAGHATIPAAGIIELMLCPAGLRQVARQAAEDEIDCMIRQVDPPRVTQPCFRCLTLTGRHVEADASIAVSGTDPVLACAPHANQIFAEAASHGHRAVVVGEYERGRWRDRQPARPEPNPTIPEVAGQSITGQPAGQPQLPARQSARIPPGGGILGFRAAARRAEALEDSYSQPALGEGSSRTPEPGDAPQDGSERDAAASGAGPGNDKPVIRRFLEALLTSPAPLP